MSRLQVTIRALLRASAEPMTVADLRDKTKARETSVRRTLANMPDAYISGWQTGGVHHDVQLWTVVVPPPNAPRPPLRMSDELREGQRQKRLRAKGKDAPAKTGQRIATSTGLTEIRGPWPTN